MTKTLAILTGLTILVGCQSTLAPVFLNLANDGQTSYVIVKPDDPTVVDDYAVRKLDEFIDQKTEADFIVVTPDRIPVGAKRIFVGLSAPALKVLGGDPLAELMDQEHVAKTVGDDIFLYGKGKHGNLYAVMDFMETTLGWRWFTKFDTPVFPPENDLNIKPFNRRKGFSFTYRTLPYASEFGYAHGMNMGLTERNASSKRRFDKYIYDPSITSYKRIPIFVHTLFGYIPPSSEKTRKGFEWLKKRDYFKSNPEFFSMDADGKRVDDRQLCFSNPALRERLTQNVLEHIKREGDDIIITLDANDNTGKFCHCPECELMEETYESPGGPMYDYLIELCRLLKKQHPNVMVKTLAYRKSQTQKPPVLPAGKTFPDNLIVVFANVEDKLDVDWTQKPNDATYADLVKWRELTSHLWTWYYPNNYGATTTHLPFGNLERLVNDIRLMERAGVDGVFYEFTTPQVWGGNGITELQVYLYCKLAEDVNADVPALIREFTDYQYGKAAKLARRYMSELEDARRAHTVHMPLIPRDLRFDDGPFGYLTLADLRDWHDLFDQMEAVTKKDKRCLANVKRLRRSLEFATLARWNELTKRYPDYFSDYLVHKKRLGELNKRELGAVNDFEIVIKTNGVEKPLPKQLRGVSADRTRRFLPEKRGRLVLDPDAAFGRAKEIDRPDFPFNFGFYQNDKKKFCEKRELKAEDIKPGVYQLYDLGEVTITPKCMVWFSNKSWCTNLELGNRLYEPGEDNKHDVYVSLKFDGPTYGGKGEKDQVLCDQVIFVRKDKTLTTPKK